MMCPNCGQENPSAFGYCTACQRPLSTVGGAAAMPGLSPGLPRPRTMGTVAKIFMVVIILLALAVAFFAARADTTDPAVMIGEQFGGLLVLLGLPMLVAWLAAGRRKVRNP